MDPSWMVAQVGRFGCLHAGQGEQTIMRKRHKNAERLSATIDEADAGKMFTHDIVDDEDISEDDVTMATHAVMKAMAEGFDQMHCLWEVHTNIESIIWKLVDKSVAELEQECERLRAALGERQTESFDQENKKW